MSTNIEQVSKIANEIAERTAYLNYLLAKGGVPGVSVFTLNKIQRAKATLDLIEIALTGQPDACAASASE